MHKILKKNQYHMRKKQTNARKRTYKGKKLRSGLEQTMYRLLKAADIPFKYEGEKFTIIESFEFKNSSYEKFLNGKGVFMDRGKKTHPKMVYTPDFIPKKGYKWVIETKGRAMPDFSRTWKLFKKLIMKNGWDTVLFLPRNKKDCIKVIELIKELEL